MDNAFLKRALGFGAGLAVAFTIMDVVMGDEINLVRTIVSGVVGGFAYSFYLKWRGR
jgi:hypothetical protein